MATSIQPHSPPLARPVSAPPHLHLVQEQRFARATTFLAVTVLTLIAAAVRLWNGAGQGLRLDEGFTIKWASLPLQPLIRGNTILEPSLFQATASDVHPPVFLLVMHFWMQAFGAGLPGLRLPSEVAGTLAVPALFLLAHSLYGRRVAVFAGLLGALSPFWIWHSQEARMYSFLLLFTILSTYGLVLALRYKRAWGWLVYFVFSLLAIYTQYFAFFVLISQALFVLWNVRQYSRRQASTWFAANIAMAIAFVPWLLMLHQYHHGASDPSLQTPTLYTPLAVFSEFLFGYLTVPITSAVLAAWPLLVPLSLALSVFAAATSRRGILLWTLLAVPLVLAFSISFVVHPFIAERYLIVCTPALYILLAIMLARIPRWPAQAAAAAVVSTVMLVAWQIEETSAANPNMEDFRTVVAYIEGHAHAGDVVALDASFNADAYLYSAHNNLTTYQLPPFSSEQTGGQPVLSDAGLRHYLGGISAGRKHLWVVYYLETNSDPRNTIRHFLSYNTAGHSVIFGGPYQRNQSQHPDSYRNVQLIRYDLIHPPVPAEYVRPITMMQARALTHLSPTTRFPYRPPFGPPGETVSMWQVPAAMPYPARSWGIPSVARIAPHEHLQIFNPNQFRIGARVTLYGRVGAITRAVSIPPQQNLDIRLADWAPGYRNVAMHVQSDSVMVPSRAWVVGGMMRTQYGVVAHRI